jgi:predicted PurR-regulated permease PerM
MSKAADQPWGRGIARRTLLATAVVLAFLGLALLLWKVREVLLITFAGVLIAVLLRAMATALSRYTRIGVTTSLTVVLILLLAMFTALVWSGGPGMVRETQALAAGLSESVADIEAVARRHPVGAWIVESLEDYDLPEAAELWERIGGIGATVFGAMGVALIAVFMGIFFAYKPALYVGGLLRLVPLDRRARAAEVLDRIGSTLRWWLVGQLISMLLLWLSTWLALSLLGVPMAFALGLLTGLLTFIPYLGPLIALIPIALVSFLVSPMLGLVTVLVYFIIQNIEANIIMPLVFEKTVSLPPALTVGSQAADGCADGAARGLAGHALAGGGAGAGADAVRGGRAARRPGRAGIADAAHGVLTPRCAAAGRLVPRGDRQLAAWLIQKRYCADTPSRLALPSNGPATRLPPLAMSTRGSSGSIRVYAKSTSRFRRTRQVAPTEYQMRSSSGRRGRAVLDAGRGLVAGDAAAQGPGVAQDVFGAKRIEHRVLPLERLDRVGVRVVELDPDLLQRGPAGVRGGAEQRQPVAGLPGGGQRGDRGGGQLGAGAAVLEQHAAARVRGENRGDVAGHGPVDRAVQFVVDPGTVGQAEREPVARAQVGADQPADAAVLAGDLDEAVARLRLRERQRPGRRIGIQQGAEVDLLRERHFGHGMDRADPQREAVGEVERRREREVDDPHVRGPGEITAHPARFVLGLQAERRAHHRAERDAVVQPVHDRQVPAPGSGRRRCRRCRPTAGGRRHRCRCPGTRS